MARNTSVHHFDAFISEKIAQDESKLEILRTKLQAGEDCPIVENFDSKQLLSSLHKKYIKQGYECPFRLVLFIDGHKVKHPSLILNKVKEIWLTLDGNYWIPKNCYYNVLRDDHESLQRAIWRISYLAKARGKGYRPPQTKDYSTSRIS